MRWPMRTCALFVLVFFIDAAAAGSPKRGDAKQPRKDQPETSDLRGITWVRDLDKALQQAKANGDVKEHPVLLLRVLGDLDGFM